jgi:pimeloyl-ACP methyl ester carboxylesterase
MVTDTADPDAFSEADVARYKAVLGAEGTMTAAVNYYRAQFREGVRQELTELLGDGRDATVRVPTLVVWGEDDAALGTELLDGLAAYVPDLQVRRLPGVSHWVQADAPGAVNEALLEFLE